MVGRGVIKFTRGGISTSGHGKYVVGLTDTNGKFPKTTSI